MENKVGKVALVQLGSTPQNLYIKALTNFVRRWGRER